MLRHDSIVENVKKSFFKNTKIQNVTSQKIAFFETLQTLLSKSFYLMHSNSTRKIHVDLNVNKKFDLKIMIYHVKSFVNWNEKNYSSKKIIKSILFFSRLLFDVEIKYWSIELKLNDIVWVFRKIRHFIDFFL